MIILEGTGSKGSLISRIEILETHRENQVKAYDEYKDQTKRSIEKLDTEMDERMKSLQLDVFKQFTDIRKQSVETSEAHHKEVKGYLIGVLSVLVIGFGTMLWKWIAK